MFLAVLGCLEARRIRDLVDGEVTVVDRVFAGLSQRSRYLRYHSGMARLTSVQRKALASVDGRLRVVLVAERCGPDGWAPEGLGRFVALGPDRAELALEVVDSAQRRGVGAALLRALTSRAAGLGYASFEASVLSTNRPVLELMRKTFGAANVRYEGPVLHLELSTVDASG